jgi:hypothetical protein
MKLLVDYNIFKDRDNLKNIIKQKFKEKMEKLRNKKSKIYKYYRLKYIGQDDGYYQMRKSRIVGASNIIFVYYHFLFKNHLEDLMSNCINYWLKDENRSWSLESDYTIDDLEVSEKVDLMEIFDKFFHSDTFHLSFKNGPELLD